MRTTAALVLALSFALCEARGNENDDRSQQCSESTGCCGICSLTQTLGSVGEKVKQLEDKVVLLETKVLNAEKEVLELRSLTGAKPQVAFSAALRDSGSGNTGPFTTATPLQYKKVFSNVGSCYNPSTGIFTAMVKGMYFFRFSMFNQLSPVPSSVVCLKKNGERLTSVWDTSGTDSNDMGSNAVVIALDVGDNVFVELQENRVVYDDVMYYNTFSGFLLFTM